MDTHESAGCVMERKLELSRMRSIGYFILFWCASVTAFGQSLEQYNWYFGNSTQAIRFNRTSRVPGLVTKAIPMGTGGSATATDPGNANLLFYTDGQFIYDAIHTRMPGGLGLTANTSANQPVAICPVPGAANKNKYFVFTNSASFTAGGTISVSVVDMNLFGNAAFPSPPLGDIESKNLATGLSNRAEGMILVPHNNGTDYWLITQQVSSQSFSSTLINASSYTGTFATTTVSGLAYPTTIANFSYHAGKKKLAAAAQDASTDAIILDFNPSTGTIALDRYILNSGKPTTTNQSIYDIEWSLKGDYLYLSRYGEAGISADVLQYDYVNPTTTLTSILPSAVFRSYGLQMAPDSSIYHLYQKVSGGPFLIGKFTKPDTIASQVNYQPSLFASSDFAGTQFPAFSPKTNPNLTVSFTSIGTCQNNNTTFFPDVQPGADSVRWDFGDGQTSQAWSPVHKFVQAQTFNVKLTAYYQGQSQSATQPVTITAFALKIQMTQDTTACRSEFPPPRGTSSPKQFSVKATVQGGTPSSYTWSNGDTGPTLTPDSAGYYYVVVKDASGCSTYAGVNVKEYKLQDQRANIWYFGNKAGIDFNTIPNPPKALSNSAMNAPEGCSVICDRNGKIIFYTDGDKVYDKKDVQIAAGIGGDPLASQSAIIVPVQGDETLFYIFTNEAINGTSGNIVKYSLFDLKQNNGLGAVVKQNQVLFSKGTERITASGKWLVIHELGNNTFRVYPVSSAGIGDPILTAIGSDHSFSYQQAGEGYMKLGPKNTLAVTLSMSPSNNLIELFHLNDTTGKLTNYRKITLKQNGVNGQIYGLEFGSGGNKLFATLKGSPSPSQVHEYFIDSIGHPYFRNRTQNNSELGALQVGPDGQIYMAINGSSVLGTIQSVGDTTKASPINFSGFALAAGTKSQLGLPNFIQQISNAFGGPSIDITGFCFGSPTNFVGTPTDQIDVFGWFFGDGGSDTQGTTTHTYAAAGPYTVSLHLTNRCGLDTTLVKPITINNPPKRPTLPGASALCNGPLTLDANTGNLPGLNYLWSDGETTKTIIVSQQSIVGVTITDANGCTSSATTLVADNQPQVDIGPDQTLCQNSFTVALNAQNPGANYAWTVNGGLATSAQSRPLDTTLPGTFIYKVTVTDPVTTCTVTDQAVFTIVASPSFTLSGTNPTSCLGANGTLTIQLNTTLPATGPYQYFITGPGAFNSQAIDQAAPKSVTLPGLKAGTYSGVVVDQVSGCTISQSFGLTDAVWTANAVPVTNCDPVQFNVTTSAAPAPTLPIQYKVTNGTTNQVVGPVSSAVANFTTTPAIAATAGQTSAFTIELTDNAGCINTINLPVTPNLPVPVTINTSGICNVSPTITASGATSYSWSGPGIVGPANGSSIVVSGQGQFTYTLVASAAGACTNTLTTTVDLDAVSPTFTQSDPCQNSVVLTAAPTGNYTYRWYKSGVFQPALLGQFISVGLPEDGASYQAETFNTLNGCSTKSPAKTISVTGVVDAGLSSTPVCDDNKPFTLTATTTATGVAYAWSRNGTVLTGLNTAAISQTNAGTYQVDITKATCKATSKLIINKAPIPVGLLPNQVIICNDPENKDPKTNQVDLDPGAFTKYDWFKNDLTISYSSRVYTATSQGTYKVDLTNSFGCVASDQVVVRNECIPKIDVPNAFRPASSITENKEFYVFSYFITDANFQIFLYNRWGELVFTSSDRYFKWNGGYNNQLSLPVPGGSYAYVIKYVSAFHPERGVQEQRGGILLLR